ncbi:MAG TPA: hypothetical protein VFB78_07535 [Acidimicrobiales bacterium]|jgi:hypothetical protein|nr:hypothetical protein [Acidimicrobiales bacterium]
MTDFQASSGIQGRQFAEQCDQLLVHYGYEIGSRLVLKDVGVEIDRVATAPSGRTIWFEYKGSVQGSRPGLLRTDTLKKAIANGALLAALPERHPYVVLTSHLPEVLSGAAMLGAAKSLGYFHDVICIYTPADTQRLRQL